MKCKNFLFNSLYSILRDKNILYNNTYYINCTFKAYKSILLIIDNYIKNHNENFKCTTKFCLDDIDVFSLIKLNQSINYDKIKFSEILLMLTYLSINKNNFISRISKLSDDLISYYLILIEMYFDKHKVYNNTFISYMNKAVTYNCIYSLSNKVENINLRNNKIYDFDIVLKESNKKIIKSYNKSNSISYLNLNKKKITCCFKTIFNKNKQLIQKLENVNNNNNNLKDKYILDLNKSNIELYSNVNNILYYKKNILSNFCNKSNVENNSINNNNSKIYLEHKTHLHVNSYKSINNISEYNTKLGIKTNKNNTYSYFNYNYKNSNNKSYFVSQNIQSFNLKKLDSLRCKTYANRNNDSRSFYNKLNNYSCNNMFERTFNLFEYINKLKISSFKFTILSDNLLKPNKNMHSLNLTNKEEIYNNYDSLNNSITNCSFDNINYNSIIEDTNCTNFDLKLYPYKVNDLKNAIYDLNKKYSNLKQLYIDLKLQNSQYIKQINLNNNYINKLINTEELEERYEYFYKVIDLKDKEILKLNNLEKNLKHDYKKQIIGYLENIDSLNSKLKICNKINLKLNKKINIKNNYNKKINKYINTFLNKSKHKLFFYLIITNLNNNKTYRLTNINNNLFNFINRILQCNSLNFHLLKGFKFTSRYKKNNNSYFKTLNIYSFVIYLILINNNVNLNFLNFTFKKNYNKKASKINNLRRLKINILSIIKRYYNLKSSSNLIYNNKIKTKYNNKLKISKTTFSVEKTSCNYSLSNEIFNLDNLFKNYINKINIYFNDNLSFIDTILDKLIFINNIFSKLNIKLEKIELCQTQYESIINSFKNRYYFMRNNLCNTIYNNKLK